MGEISGDDVKVFGLNVVVLMGVGGEVGVGLELRNRRGLGFGYNLYNYVCKCFLKNKVFYVCNLVGEDFRVVYRLLFYILFRRDF